ncbi:hypothetical protein Nepgr_020346 [Nepenthes gracilis]|uniref:Uncharacterized protein n=1 Tax=Nepenthes gracilis TaxID=150966 RepID=A0AAD3SWP1_NEPGR|nr:hypothetical protein Nepgr_020346 [Nepenthes gracilis]
MNSVRLPRRCNCVICGKVRRSLKPSRLWSVITSQGPLVLALEIPSAFDAESCQLVYSCPDTMDGFAARLGCAAAAGNLCWCWGWGPVVDALRFAAVGNLCGMFDCTLKSSCAGMLPGLMSFAVLTVNGPLMWVVLLLRLYVGLSVDLAEFCGCRSGFGFIFAREGCCVEATAGAAAYMIPGFAGASVSSKLGIEALVSPTADLVCWNLLLLLLVQCDDVVGLFCLLDSGMLGCWQRLLSLAVWEMLLQGAVDLFDDLLEVAQQLVCCVVYRLRMLNLVWRLAVAEWQQPLQLLIWCGWNGVS